MKKTDFLKTYRHLLTIHFFDDGFMKDGNITILERKMPLRELMDFYVLRTVKDGLPDTRGIEDRENDLESKLITLKKARQNPIKWDLDLRHRAIPTHENIRPIPVATDLRSKRTLILDSNHLLANWNHADGTSIPLVQIFGPNLEKIVPDFIILNRQ